MHNNQALRALFTLPPVQPSASTTLAVPAMPPPQTVFTGDDEVDTVLWLQSVVDTGRQSLIDKALEAAKRIKTPMKELQDRYTSYLVVQSRGNIMQAALETLDFGRLEDRAQSAIKKAQRRHEAISRFGSADAIFGRSAAEEACAKALRGLRRSRSGAGYFNAEKAEASFAAHPDLVPHTLSDVLHVQRYDSDLSRLRAAAGDGAGDPWPELSAYDDYSLRMLARIVPRDAAEALAVFEWLTDSEKMEVGDSADIIRNLIAGRLQA